MIIREDKSDDSYLFQSQGKKEVKMRTLQDIIDCLLSDSEKECKHCKKVVTCGFTWQALFTLNSYQGEGGFNDYAQNRTVGG
ncbi:MAG: hypothetical protein HZC48_02490 [Nitrospirae bacterium]|nr:hypothetical protein [Nitrospirota bacterium]